MPYARLEDATMTLLARPKWRIPFELRALNFPGQAAWFYGVGRLRLRTREVSASIRIWYLVVPTHRTARVDSSTEKWLDDCRDRPGPDGLE